MAIRCATYLSVVVVAMSFAAVAAQDDLFRATLGEREQKLIDAINRERKNEDVTELKPHRRLMAAARLHAQNMAKLDRGSHEFKEEDIEDFPSEWRTPSGRLAYVKWQGTAWGENIAWGSTDADTTVRGWMSSEGHRRNILNPDFTEIGVGLARSGGAPYWCAVFGRTFGKDRGDEIIGRAKEGREAGQSARSSAGENWRYRWHQGRWWYWLPDKRWVVWLDGRWVEVR